MKLHTASRIGLVAAFFIVVGLCVAVGTAFAHDKAAYDIIADETYIAGIDVSGMSAQEATQAVSQYAQEHAANVSMTLSDPDTGKTYPISLASSVRYDVNGAVERAIQRNHDTPALSRVLDDVLKQPAERMDIDLAYTVEDANLQSEINAFSGSIHVDPVDASREFNDDNTVTITPETVGRELAVKPTTDAATDAIKNALSHSTSLSDLARAPITVPMTITPLQPAETVENMPYGVIVDYANFMLYVFDGDQEIYHVMIGYGRGWEGGSNYSSPSGLHYIEYFDSAPTWSNPDPEGWGKDYKVFYAGGEKGNPLGSRAMKISDAPMVYIHGVNDPNCIGNRLSHGCLNVWDSDVIELFSLLRDNAEEKDSSSIGGQNQPIWVYFHGYPG